MVYPVVAKKPSTPSATQLTGDAHQMNCIKFTKHASSK